MKKFVLSALAVVFAMFLMTSCGKDVEKEIVGKWKIEKADLTNLEELVTELAKSFGLGEAEIEEMKKEMQDGMNEEFIGSTIEFVEDHTFKSPDGEGKWTYNKEKNAFEIEESSTKYDLIVDKLSGNNLDLTMEMEDNGMEFKITMSLTRE